MNTLTATRAATTTQPLPSQISLAQLDPRLQDLFHKALDAAEQATSVWHIKDIHEFAAAALGLHLSANGELVQCSCEACPDACDAVCDLNRARIYLDGTVRRPQCPACADDHPHDGE